MPAPSHRWSAFGTSIFSTMTQAAVRANAVNLAQGFPDFDGPDALKVAVTKAMVDGKNQYAPAAGILALREKIAERRFKNSGISWDPESEITIATGATEGLWSSIQAICEPGDEVIVLAPFYDSYPAAIHAAGAKIKVVNLTPPTWKLNKEALAAACTDRTRAIIVNSPHNPTGYVFSTSDLEAIAEICLKHDLLAITDEVYEEIWFTPQRPGSLSAIPGMRDRTVVVSSAAKTFSLTGWKVGWVCAPRHLTERFRTVHQYTVFCTATPLQYGVLAGFELEESYFEQMRTDFKAKRNQLGAILAAQGFHFEMPMGSYFILADYSRLSQKDDLDFAIWMTNQMQVASVPLSPFFLEPISLKYLRFAFCKRSETLAAANQRMQRPC